MVYGRISKSWGKANNVLRARDGMKTIEPNVFTGRLISEFWQFGLAVWAQRNETEHGLGYSVSIIEKERVRKTIVSLYVNLRDIVKKEDEWIFGKSLRKRLEESYDTQVAWLEVIRRMYKYHEFEWFEEDFRTRAYIDYVAEAIYERSTMIW